MEGSSQQVWATDLKVFVPWLPEESERVFCINTGAEPVVERREIDVTDVVKFCLGQRDGSLSRGYNKARGVLEKIRNMADSTGRVLGVTLAVDGKELVMPPIYYLPMDVADKLPVEKEEEEEKDEEEEEEEEEKEKERGREKGEESDSLVSSESGSDLDSPVRTPRGIIGGTPEKQTEGLEFGDVNRRFFWIEERFVLDKQRVVDGLSSHSHLAQLEWLLRGMPRSCEHTRVMGLLLAIAEHFVLQYTPALYRKYLAGERLPAKRGELVHQVELALNRLMSPAGTSVPEGCVLVHNAQEDEISVLRKEDTGELFVVAPAVAGSAEGIRKVPPGCVVVRLDNRMWCTQMLFGCEEGVEPG